MIAALRGIGIQIFQQAVELVTLVEIAQCGGVSRLFGQRLKLWQPIDMAAQVAIGFDGDQLLADGQPVERLAQVFTCRALDVGGIGHQGIE